MKQLELSAEKAVEREEKLKDKILNIQQKYKAAEGRYVCYGNPKETQSWEFYRQLFFLRNPSQYGTHSTVGYY